jgi:hypothetical protein
MWTCLNRRQATRLFTHFVFFDEENRHIAIADHSIRIPNDPASTDDGLLLCVGITARDQEMHSKASADVPPPMTVPPPEQSPWVPPNCISWTPRLRLVSTDGTIYSTVTSPEVVALVDALLTANLTPADLVRLTKGA